MADGERHKNLETYGRLMDFLLEHRHNRTTTLVALGGGVVGDLTGFAAATYSAESLSCRFRPRCSRRWILP